MRRYRWWVRRGCTVIAAIVALTVAVPPGQQRPVGGSEFPLAGLWDLLTTRPGWTLDRPTTPKQRSGGAVAGAHSVPGDATRAGGGVGRPVGKVPGALQPQEQLGRQVRGEWTTPKARTGFDRSTSRLVQSGTGSDFDLYENADGSFTRRIYSKPANFKGSDGVWRPIDTRLVRGQRGRWQVSGNTVQVSFAGATAAQWGSGVAATLDPAADSMLEAAASTEAVELASMTLPSGETLGYQLVGASLGTPSVDGATATYFDALPSTDVELTATRDGIKETLVLDSRDAANSWVFPLRLDGLTSRMEPDGSVALLDQAGTAVALIPRGYMQDSRMQRDGDFTTSDAVRYELITVDGGPALRVTADRSWLDDPARAYPVRVDPSAVMWDNSGDVYVDATGVRNVDSLAVGCFDPDGGGSAGCDKRRSFMSFNYYGYAYGAPNSSMAGVYVTSAKLHLFHTWSEDCTNHRKVYAYRVTQPWSVSSMPNGRYPGAAVGASPIGELQITDNYPACTNTSGNRGINKEWVMNLTDLSVFHDWSRDSSTNHGIALVSENDNDRTGWKRFVSRDSINDGQYAPFLDLTWEYNTPPQIEAQYPTHGYSSPTLTPELLVSGRDPNMWPSSTLTYKFFISEVDGTTVTPVADSGGYTPGTKWVVPSGKLAWAKNYVWTVQAWDGKDVSTSQAWNSLSTAVPQPPITSGLSQNSGAGFAPNIGNYTNSATDAQVPTVGPALSVQRSYNSRDPRTTNAFGAGWSSLLDAKAVEAGSTVVITYPSGQDVAFGRNSDGTTFTPPSGRFATFEPVTGGGYELVDKDGTKYLFTEVLATGRFGLRSVTDAQGRALMLAYTASKVTGLTAASGRKLTVAWSGSHVSEVSNEAAEKWTYTYTGDSLTKVCPPTSATACTVYTYGTNWAHPTAVQDAGPHTYLRLNDAAGSATAISAVPDRLDTAIGVYRNVSLGQPGVIAQAGAAAGFNGTSSHVELPKKVAWSASWMSVSLWFKTTSSGVLYGFQNRPLADSANAGSWNPGLYVDTAGYLRGVLWTGSIETIASVSPVNDGTWHHVVLTASGNTQEMFVDGQSAGQRLGTITDQWTTHVYVGAGKWQLWPNTSGTIGYFNGSISDFAFYTRPLPPMQVALMHSSGRAASAPLTIITRPSGGISAQVAYNTATGALTQVTDANNGVWKVGTPKISGTGQAYTSAVMAAAPADYFRLVGINNEVNGVTGAFSNVTLGGSVSGPLGETAAQFNGSYVLGSGSSIDTSQSYSVSTWVYLTDKSGNKQVAAVDGERVSPFYFGYENSSDRWRMKVCQTDIDSPSCPGVVSSSVPAMNAWTHLATTVDASSRTVKLYVNGSLEGTTTVPAMWKANGPFTIGRARWNGGYSDSWPGRLAEVATFRSALTEDQVRQQYGARDLARGFRQLPVDNVVTSGPNSVSVWFQLPAGDTAGGVIYGYQSAPVTDTAATQWNPALYVGTDGKLRGKFWVSGANPMASPAPVNDGNWHHVVLAASTNAQDLYLDGVKIGSIAGAISPNGTAFAYLGAGKWTNWAGTAGDVGYFGGQISDFAFHNTQLSSAQASAQFTSGRSAGVDVSGAQGTPIATVAVTDPANEVTSHLYDMYAGGREIEQVDPLGGRTRYGFDEQGFMRTTTDPNGNLTISEHDVRGNVIAKVTCQNRSAGKCSTTYYSYYPDATSKVLTPDPRNDRLLTIRDARSLSATDDTYLTTYTYDTTGNLIEVKDPLNRITKTVYTTGKSIPADLTGLSGTGRYVRVYGTKRGYPAGYSIWEFEVYGSGATNLTRRRPATSSSNETTDLSADKAVDGDPTTRWSSQYSDPQWIYADLGALQNISRVKLTWETAFGANYQIQVSNDASTWTTIKTVEAQNGRPVPAGLPIRTTSPGGAEETTSYLASGDIAETVDASDLHTLFSYDAVGRPTAKTVKSVDTDLVTAYTYDKLGRVVTVTDPAALNRVTSATHTKVATTAHDLDGQITSVRTTDTTGGDAARETTSGYNTLGQKTSETDARGNITRYEYDLFGHTSKVTRADGAATRLAYDKNGNRTSTTLLGWTGDPNNPLTPTDLLVESRAYDRDGRLAAVTDAMGWVTEYKYTDNGLTASVTRRDPSNGATFIVESNVYDAAGNLTETVTNNGTAKSTYAVDAASRTWQQIVDPAGLNRKTEFTYGADDTVLAVKIADGSGAAAHYVDAAYDLSRRKLSHTVSASGTAGLAGRWKLDGTPSDTFGNSPGTATAVTWSAERGGAAVFDGTTAQITMPGPVLDTGQSFTVSAWAKLDDKATTRIIAGQWGQNRLAFNLEYSSYFDRWAAVVGPTDQPGGSLVARSDATPALGTWTHVAGVYDAVAKTLTLYINGVAQALSVTNLTMWSGNGQYCIGGIGGSRFKGSIDDVQAYQKALTGSQIAAVYNGTAPATQDAARTSWRLDRRGMQTATTDPSSNVTYLEYDSAGRQTTMTSPSVSTEENGGTAVTAPIVNRAGYNTFGEQVEVRNGRGEVTVAARDANGQITENMLPAYTPSGSSTELHPVVKTIYDSVGRIIKTIDPLLNETSYVYDQMGRLASVTTPNSGVSKYTYTPNGQQMSVTDQTGARTEATYDFLGRKATATQVLRSPSAAHTTNFAYHNAGWLASVTPPGRAATTYTYNNAGEITRIVDGAGLPVDFGYDFAGRNAWTKLADNSKQTTGYDFAGRPIIQQTVNPAGGIYSTIAATYDRSSRLLTSTDARGTVTSLGYDALGRITQATQPVSATESITTSFGYDASGNRTRFTDGRNSNFLSTYNSWNLPESRIEPATATHPDLASRTFTTVYDVAGRPVEARSPGAVTTVNTFDAMGQLTRSTGSGAEAPTAERTFGYDLAGRVTSLSGSGGTNTLSYDDRSLLVSASGPSGSSTFTYTPDGLPASRQDAAGTTAYGYDAGGRLSTLSNTAAGLQVGYSYDNLSQISQLTYGANENRRILGYATDGSHRLVSDELKTAAGAPVAKIAYAWDKNGNLTSKTTTGFAGAGSNAYTYDWANRLTAWNSGTTTVDYSWDHSGNRRSSGARTFTYDERNRLVSSNDGTSYTYTARGTLRGVATGTVNMPTEADAFGQVTKQYTSNTAFTEYTYDGLGRMVRTGFAYTGIGNDLAADPAAKYVRGPGGALTGVQTTGPGVYAWTDLHTDVVGQFGAASTTLTGSNCFDPFGKNLATAGMIGSLGYQSGWTDTGTGRINMHSRWYNTDTGQFDTRDSADLTPLPSSINANRYAYGNGNPLVNIDPTGHIAMATGSDTDEQAYLASLPADERQATVNAKNKTRTDAIRTGMGGSPVTTPPVNDIDFGGPPSGCVEAAWGSQETEGCAFDVNINTIDDVNCRVFYPDGRNSGGPAVWNCDGTIVDPGGSFGSLTPGADTNCTTLADTWMDAEGAWQSTTQEVCNGFGKGGNPIVSLDEQAWHLYQKRFVDLTPRQQREVFAYVTCNNNPEMCEDANNVFDFLIGLIPVAGTAYDVIKCIGGDADACMWILPSMIPGGRLAELGKLGKLGKQMEEMLRAQKAAGGGLGGAPAPAFCSFTGDTKVLMADGSQKPIKDVQVGDKVEATDPESGKDGPRTVTALWIHEDDIVELDIDGTILRTTEDHPFWNDTDKQWQRADQLDRGDRVLAEDGTRLPVHGIIGSGERMTTAYNLTVDDIHTYYVMAGDKSVLVHNDSRCLGRNLGAPPFGGPAQAHHIVPERDPLAADARAILDGYGIKIDSPENGVWLSPNGHYGTFPKNYARWINDEIVAANAAGGKAAVLEVLERVKQELAGTDQWIRDQMQA